MAQRKKIVPTVCLFFGWLLFSCGLQDIPYISRISDPLNSTLSGTGYFQLPSSGEEGYGDTFTHFIIFYRIYLSTYFHAADTVDITSPQLSAISAQLNTDFSVIFPWADPTNMAVNTAGVFNFFITNRGFLALELEDAAIGSVLGRGSLGGTINIDFADIPGQSPRLWVDGRYYYLRRAEGSPHFGDFEPQPRIGVPPNVRLPFFNHHELLSRENRTNEINADVVIPAGHQEMLHSYVLMYIVAAGADNTVPPSAVFSQPTFLGIFRLPSPN